MQRPSAVRVMGASLHPLGRLLTSLRRAGFAPVESLIQVEAL